MKILDSGKKTAKENMSLDASLLDQLNAQDKPTLHFYDWEKPSLTHGYFISVDKHLDLKKLKENKIEVARRPTGGGIVFHLWDLAFSFLMPAGHKYFFESPLKNYQFVNQIILKALKNLTTRPGFLEKQDKLNSGSLELKEQNPLAFCMARPSKYDLIFQGKKAAGAAQRKKHNGYLHQGTISLVVPDEKLLLDLLLDPKLAKAILEESFFLSDEMKDLADIRAELKQVLLYQFEKTLG